MNELYYNKYLKYRNKYLYLKLSISSHQSGGNNNQKTFYLNMEEKKFESILEKYLIELGYKRSTTFPVNFIFLSGEAIWYKNRFDAKKSEWISVITGNSKTEITNKILLHKRYENFNFIIPSKYLTQFSPIPDINERTIKILKPLNGFAGSGIRIVQTKTDIKLWLDLNEKYKEWLLEDYIIDPDLKDGYKFHFRVLILVKVFQNKSFEVYISNQKFYITAKEKYKKTDWLNKNIHDTHFNQTIDYLIFPKYLPDSWTKEDALLVTNNMNNIIIDIFKKQTEFQPDRNSLNSFEIFGADFIFSNKHAYLLEINDKIGYKTAGPIIPGIIETVLLNKDNEYFTKLI
jgi:hypothetical protein